MPVTPAQFMESAAAVVNQPDTSEIDLRNAGSRAYYALFHTATQVLKKSGVLMEILDNSGSHERVIATLCKLSLPAKSVAVAIGDVKRFRHICDYKTEKTVGVKEAQFQVAKARALIERLERLKL
jgi:uncharacterized protein (UPF0332 family)